MPNLQITLVNEGALIEVQYIQTSVLVNASLRLSVAWQSQFLYMEVGAKIILSTVFPGAPSIPRKRIAWHDARQCGCALVNGIFDACVQVQSVAMRSRCDGFRTTVTCCDFATQGIYPALPLVISGRKICRSWLRVLSLSRRQQHHCWYLHAVDGIDTARVFAFVCSSSSFASGKESSGPHTREKMCLPPS